MTKKHYITIAITSLLVLIAIALFNFYYQTYVAPESFVIGSVKIEDYKTLPIKDYLSDEDVLFSQNINDVSFSNKNGIATYEYNFDAKEFDGEQKDYVIYVNDYLISNLTENAGTVGGIHALNYYDVEKQVLCSSAINIDFSFYSLSSKLKVTLNSEDLGYLMNYFKTDNFIITLAENPFVMMNKDVEVETPPIDETQEIDVAIYSGVGITVNYNGETKDYSPTSATYREDLLTVYKAKSTDEIRVKHNSFNKYLKVQIDGEYTVEEDGEFQLIKWQNASVVVIKFTAVQPAP